MKNLKFPIVLFLGCLLWSCSPEEGALTISGDENRIQDISTVSSTQTYSEANYSGVILAIDAAIQASISGVEDTNELSQIFIDQLESNSFTTFINQGLPVNSYSQEFYNVANIISNTSTYESHSDYSAMLLQQQQIVSETITNEEEATQAITIINFQLELINYFNDIAISNGGSGGQTTTNGWWSDWGKCAAGILGGAITGGAIGCGAVGSVGALVGAAVTVPAGSVPGAVVGGLAGCAVGGIAGQIGGALTGAAMFCD